MDVVSSSPAVAPRQPLSVTSMPFLMGTVLAIIALLFWYFDFFDGSGESIVVARGFPAEELSVLASGKLRTLDKKVPGTLEDYAVGKGTKAAIVRMEEGAFEVFTLGGIPRQLTVDGARKASLAISDDGEWIAYAALSDLEPEKTEQLSSWIIYILNTKTAAVLSLSKGYAPQFFTREGKTQLFFPSPRGLTVFDPSSGTSVTDFYDIQNAIHAVPTIAKDGKHIALNDANTNLYSVFEVWEIAPFVIHAVRTIPEPLSSVAFSGDALLGISPFPDNTVYSFDFTRLDAAPKTYHLPDASQPYRLLP